MKKFNDNPEGGERSIFVNHVRVQKNGRQMEKASNDALPNTQLRKTGRQSRQ